MEVWYYFIWDVHRKRIQTLTDLLMAFRNGNISVNLRQAVACFKNKILQLSTSKNTTYNNGNTLILKNQTSSSGAIKCKDIIIYQNKEAILQESKIIKYRQHVAQKCN